MLSFPVPGVLLGLYNLWGLIAYPLKVSVRDHRLVYLNVLTTTTPVAVLYVAATA